MMNETTKQVFIITTGICFIALCYTAHELVKLLPGA